MSASRGSRERGPARPGESGSREPARNPGSRADGDPSRGTASKAHVSIHDVTPDTLLPVGELVDLVTGAGLPPPLLLVVPGRDWDSDSLADLRRLGELGCRLAGHGWSHRAPEPTSLGHRIHAAVLSRNQAEHLSRSRDEVRRRVRRCHAWFADHDLEVEPIYVPPAWALGPLSRSDLEELPFRYFETLTGFVDSATGRALRLPLVGFEADTPARRRALRLSNALNLTLGRWSERAVRIGFHPRDLDLLLSGDARDVVRRPWRCFRVTELFAM